MTRSLALSELVDGQYLDHKLADIRVNGVCLDSRKVEPGNLFIALGGSRDDGTKYIKDAVEKGAVAVVTDMGATPYQTFDAQEKNSRKTDSQKIIHLPGLQKQVSDIAGRFYGKPSEQLQVVGITGTNGKTSCAQLLAQALVLLGESCGVIGTLGYGQFGGHLDDNLDKNAEAAADMQSTGMTTPDAVSSQKILADFVAGNMTYAAMEVSSHGLQQHRLDAVAIDTAVLTNLTHDHLDYHGSFEEYARAKSRLFAFDSLQHAVLNLDDDFSRQLINDLGDDVTVTTVSANGKPPLGEDNRHWQHLSVRNIEASARGMSLELEFFSTDRQQTLDFHTSLVGDFNISNLLLVVGVLLRQGFSLEAIASVVPDLSPVPGRMQLVADASAEVQVVLDYAHTPDALEKALQALKPVTSGSLWCVFGCGGDRDKGKRPMMAAIAERLADHIVVTSDNPRFENPEKILADIESGFGQHKHRMLQDRRKAIMAAVLEAKAGDLVLVAGKGHEDYQIIGAEKHDFSDLDEVKESLAKRKQQGADL